jgi:hypothetical protein
MDEVGDHVDGIGKKDKPQEQICSLSPLLFSIHATLHEHHRKRSKKDIPYQHEKKKVSRVKK